MTHSHETARLAVLVAAEPEPEGSTVPLPWLRRLCRAAVRQLPATGVGVSVRGEGGGPATVTAASDRACERVEELQLVLGEGPCLDALATRRPVLEDDVRLGTRWPVYSPAVREHGVRAVFAFPLQVGAARLGVLGVYRSEPGPLSNTALAQALSFADLVVEWLLDGQESASVGSLQPALAEALEYRSEIYQAQGMVMVDLGVGLPEAMARLRAHAYAHDRRLGTVARDVVAGRLVLEADVP